MPLEMSYVTIDLLSTPRAGDRSVLTRYNLVDKVKIDHAAWILGISTAAFNRMVTVKVAEAVIATAEGTKEFEQEPPNEPIIVEKAPNLKHVLSRHVPPGVKR
jgi:hypothetical protein